MKEILHSMAKRLGPCGMVNIRRWMFDLPRFSLIFAIRLYRWTISPALPFLFGPTGGCRFTPSCSQYAMDAVRARGAFAGSWLAVKRICRCHPWGGCGHDTVPETKFGVRPLPLHFDMAGVEARRTGARGEGGNSEARI